MRLKGIEMQGFKSFADRVRLTFEDGITAVVGPNGSGKSNISDAVKWVFGEQSVKSLRGSKMEDVIFGGTAGRRPQGFAWVSLIIENADRSIGVDSDEVTITRKLYRSGESEYKINGNPVRLKDIHELFMDTGLGRDGYSVIEQGKIAEIVSAKSTQRREIFEEAAGISKYRYRKEEAERQLEKAEDNLVRLRDIMSELENRVGPLRVQAEKAKKYLVLADEKKTLEISIWLDNLEKLRTEIREQEDKILVCKNDRNASQMRLDEIEGRLEELYRAIQDCEIYIDRKRGEIKELEEQLSGAQVVIAVKENDARHNEASIAALEKELQSGTAAAGDFDARIAEKEADLSALTLAHDAQREKSAQTGRELEESRREEAALAASLDALALQREQLRESISGARVSSETSAGLVEETLRRMEALREQTREKDLHTAALRQEMEENAAFCRELDEKLQSLENTKNGYAYKLSGRREKLAEAEAVRQGLEKQAGEKLQKAQLLSDLEKNMEGFSGSVRLVMKQAAAGALRGVIGPVSSLISVEDKHATAIEIALGAAMQNIVVEDEGAAKRAIALLRDSKAGRCTFLPLNVIRGSVLQEKGLSGQPGYIGIAAELVVCDGRYRDIINNILGRVAVARDIDAAVEIARVYSHRFRIVTLDGQVVNAGGSLTGGYLGKSARILGRRQEIETLQIEAKALLAKAAEAEERVNGVSRELSEIEALLDAVEAESKTAVEDKIAAAAETRRLTLALQEAESLARTAVQEFDALTARVEELRGQSLSSEELIAKLNESLEQVDTQLTKGTQRQAELARQTQALSEALSDGQVTLAGLSKDIETTQETLEMLRCQRAGSGTRLAEIEREIAGLRAENEEIARKVEETHQLAAQSRETTARLNKEIQEKMKEREGCEQKTSLLRANERTETAQREALSGELARLEERYVSMTTESDALTAKLWDEYELTKSQAAETAIPLEDYNAAVRRLTELRNKIRALGSVNVDAVEEYKEVSERYEFFRSQIEDVEKSKTELTRLIADLSGNMSKIFLEKFAAINRHFGVICTELFGGGKGELRLTDPDDPLRTGIDIFVQPSGKLVGLSLLSGGEKAIVAICIYFAILKVNPAPFVLLDEIEAALDEVNVVRFASYMRKMCEGTQFIAITHRRGTIEEADVLYGVTMEEEGVSKLLRLNVDELEEKLHIEAR